MQKTLGYISINASKVQYHQKLKVPWILESWNKHHTREIHHCQITVLPGSQWTPSCRGFGWKWHIISIYSLSVDMGRCSRPEQPALSWREAAGLSRSKQTGAQCRLSYIQLGQRAALLRALGPACPEWAAPWCLHYERLIRERWEVSSRECFI